MPCARGLSRQSAAVAHSGSAACYSHRDCLQQPLRRRRRQRVKRWSHFGLVIPPVALRACHTAGRCYELAPVATQALYFGDPTSTAGQTSYTLTATRQRTPANQGIHAVPGIVRSPPSHGRRVRLFWTHTRERQAGRQTYRQTDSERERERGRD